MNIDASSVLPSNMHLMIESSSSMIHMKLQRALIITSLSAIVIGGAAAAFLWHTPVEMDVSEEELGGFAGTVVDGVSGAPLPATVSVAQAGQRLAFQNCAQDGVFNFDLEDGKYRFSATYDGYVSKGKRDQEREIDIEDGTRYVNARFQLWPEARLAGRVMAGDRGIQANIRLSYQEDRSGETGYVFAQEETDENGAFEIAHAYAGIVSIDVAAEGFANLNLSDIALEPGKTTDLGEIPMRDGVSIYGNVLDFQSKQPLGGVRIQALDMASRAVLAETRSLAAGNYRLPVVDSGRVFVTAELEGYRIFSADVRLAGTLNRQFDFALKRAWGLVIQISNETGREPIKSHIQVTDLRTQNVLYNEIHDNGTFTLNDFKDGPYLVSATSFDGDTSYEVRAMAGDNVRLVLKPYAGFNVSVVSRAGEPVTSGEYRYLYSDENGGTKYSTWEPFSSATFDIDGLKQGKYRVEVRVSHDRVSSAPEVMLQHGEYHTLKIQLTEGGVLRGRVVTRDGRGVSATIEGVGTSLKASTDNEGNFVIDQLPDTTFELRIRPENGEEKIFSGIHVSENQELVRDFEVEATVREKRPRPRAGRLNRDAGERPAPPWGNGTPPWGDGPPPTPPWGDGTPPWGDGPPPAPPWGDGAPPWGDGTPPWGDGTPPWGDGAPPWGDGAPPWGDGERPAAPRRDTQRGFEPPNRPDRQSSSGSGVTHWPTQATTDAQHTDSDAPAPSTSQRSARPFGIGASRRTARDRRPTQESEE